MKDKCVNEEKMDKKENYPTIDVKRTGLNLKRICQENHLSIAVLQNYLGLSCPQTVYRWFSGHAVPSLDHLYALSHLLKLPIEKLLVKERLLGRNCVYILVRETMLVKNWEFIMRMMNYQSKQKLKIHRR